MAVPALRWGILGTGNIARKFARDVLTLGERARLVAVGSRGRDKAEVFASAHGGIRAHGSYQDLLDDPEVDAVYVSLLNHLHAEWSIKAAQAGKHVLCEKPSCMDARQLDKVLAAARKHDVFFMEAFMYRCHPRWAALRELLRGGEIGEVRMLHATFAFNVGGGPSRVLDLATGGGGLLDIGVYPVSWMRMVAGEEPYALRGLGHVGKESEVDEWACGLLQFRSGIVGSFACGVRCSQPTLATVYGEKGYIECLDPWFCKNAVFRIHTAGGVRELTVVDSEALYAREALTVAEHLAARQAPAMSWDDSRGQIRVIDEIRHQIGLWWPGEKS